MVTLTDSAFEDLLDALKERHELAMSLLYDSKDPASNSYLRNSKSGQVTQLLQKYGVEPDIPQKLI